MSGIRDVIDPVGGNHGSGTLPPRRQAGFPSPTPVSARGSTVPMDVDDVQDDQEHYIQRKRPRLVSRSPSWHSEETSSRHLGDRSNSTSGHSQSENQNTAQSDTPITGSNADDPLFHAAYRLFKASMKAASEKYGPYLPPDDGSPFLSSRLTRMWNDLSPEQRAGWYARAARELNSEFAFESRSPHLSPSGSVLCTPPSTAVSAARTTFSGSESIGGFTGRTDTMDTRSPGSFIEEDPMGGPSALHSPSESPGPGDDTGSSQSHVPRPPNAWILFRSTMSKTRKPDGIVYSPPEISLMWKELSKEDRDIWYDRAKEAKQQHEAANPGYRYQPNRKRQSGVRKLTEVSASNASSSARSATRPSHPGPSSPPWHAQV